MTGHQVISMELEPDLEHVSTARRFVRSHLSDVDDVVAADVQLITSELVTNAIEHGAGGPVTLALEADDEIVVVSVESGGPSPNVGPVDDWQVAAADEIDGRGLGIVRAIASEVAVSRSAGRLTITAQIAR